MSHAVCQHAEVEWKDVPSWSCPQSMTVELYVVAQLLISKAYAAHSTLYSILQVDRCDVWYYIADEAPILHMVNWYEHGSEWAMHMLPGVKRAYFDILAPQLLQAIHSGAVTLGVSH